MLNYNAIVPYHTHSSLYYGIGDPWVGSIILQPPEQLKSPISLGHDIIGLFNPIADKGVDAIWQEMRSIVIIMTPDIDQKESIDLTAVGAPGLEDKSANTKGTGRLILTTGGISSMELHLLA